MKGKKRMLNKKDLRMFSNLGGAAKAIMAGAAGAALVAGNIGKSIQQKTAGISSHMFKNNSKDTREVVEMKKSTLIALFVALATVAGVLGALYVYVIRREKELDEYEQLLFSEDFSDEFEDEAITEEPVAEEVKE